MDIQQKIYFREQMTRRIKLSPTIAFTNGVSPTIKVIFRKRKNFAKSAFLFKMRNCERKQL